MAMGIQSNCNSMLTTLGWAGEELFWFPSFMGMADFILAGEGDLYDINEYHMLSHLIILNKVDEVGTFLAQSVHEDVVLYISGPEISNSKSVWTAK